MRKAQIGDSVRIHFTASQDDGNQVATTRNETPMDLAIGDKNSLIVLKGPHLITSLFLNLTNGYRSC